MSDSFAEAVAEVPHLNLDSLIKAYSDILSGKKINHTFGNMILSSTLLNPGPFIIPMLRLDMAGNASAKSPEAFYFQQALLWDLNSPEISSAVLEELQKHGFPVRSIGIQNNVRNIFGSGWIGLSVSRNAYRGIIPVVVMCFDNGGTGVEADPALEVDIGDRTLLLESQGLFKKAVFSTRDKKEGIFRYLKTIVVEMHTDWILRQLMQRIGKCAGFHRVRLGFHDLFRNQDLLTTVIRYDWYGEDLPFNRVDHNGCLPSHPACCILPMVFAVSVGGNPHRKLKTKFKVPDVPVDVSGVFLERAQMKRDAGTLSIAPDSRRMKHHHDAAESKFEDDVIHRTEDTNAEAAVDGDTEEFDVDHIVGHKFERRDAGRHLPEHLKFLVRWKGFTSEEDTWEPWAHVFNLAAIDTYAKANPGLNLPFNPEDPEELLPTP